MDQVNVRDSTIRAPKTHFNFRLSTFERIEVIHEDEFFAYKLSSSPEACIRLRVRAYLLSQGSQSSWWRRVPVRAGCPLKAIYGVSLML